MSIPIYTAEQIKAWDQFTIEKEAISSFDLMERAASTFVMSFIEKNPMVTAVNIFAGVGNNGGDGLVVARFLLEHQIRVNLFVVEFSKNYTPDFLTNLNKLKSKLQIRYINETFELAHIPEVELNIDAIFGYGLNREIEDGWLADLIHKINHSKLKTIAIDIPSGLFPFDNRTNSLKNVIQASRTYTFQVPKLPFFFKKYEKYVGNFVLLDINLHPKFKTPSNYLYLEMDDINLKPISKFVHKGDKGHLLLVGGYENMYGAITLSAKAAYKTGCGYVYVNMDEQGQSILLNHCLESVFIKEIDPFLPKIKAIGVGPGLGQSIASVALLKKVLVSANSNHIPIVIDADAINIIATHKELLSKLSKNTVLTPHQKELERLIGIAVTDEDLLEKQRLFSMEHQVFIVQKGAHSKLTTPNGEVFINSTGNNGMAVAGMGDVLTGIIGAFLAQRYTVEDASKFGMLLHGAAADNMRKKVGNRGYLPSELINEIPKVLNEI
jgi:NAD(P)H-hydrate epimerase